MPECTKGPCDRPATVAIKVRDGQGDHVVLRCEEHEDDPVVGVVQARQEIE